MLSQHVFLLLLPPDRCPGPAPVDHPPHKWNRTERRCRSIMLRQPPWTPWGLGGECIWLAGASGSQGVHAPMRWGEAALHERCMQGRPKGGAQEELAPLHRTCLLPVLPCSPVLHWPGATHAVTCVWMMHGHAPLRPTAAQAAPSPTCHRGGRATPHIRENTDERLTGTARHASVNGHGKVKFPVTRAYAEAVQGATIIRQVRGTPPPCSTRQMPRAGAPAS